jgi:hypothetical protein
MAGRACGLVRDVAGHDGQRRRVIGFIRDADPRSRTKASGAHSAYERACSQVAMSAVPSVVQYAERFVCRGVPVVWTCGAARPPVTLAPVRAGEPQETAYSLQRVEQNFLPGSGLKQALPPAPEMADDFISAPQPG